MKKALMALSFVILLLFFISCTKDNAESEEGVNIEQKIGELQEKIQELAVKIETNPEAEEANQWREMRRKYTNEMEALMAEAKEGSERDELSEIEKTKGAIQEYKVALEENPDHKNADQWRVTLKELEAKLERLQESEEGEYAAGETRIVDREARIKNIQEQILELKNALERDPDSENAERWKGALREYEQELEALSRGEEKVSSGYEEREYPEFEMAIRQREEQTKELELYRADLQEKGASEDKIKEAELNLDKNRKELLELRTALEERKKGIQQAQPSAYQREHGELEAYVISATSEDVTVRIKDSEKVMVIRIPARIRVEGQRVENTEMKKLAASLKKDELVWIDYQEGEERGIYFAAGLKKIK